MPHSIKIRGVEPPDYAGLSSELRRQFWALVVPIALRIKDAELKAGLDAHGDPLKPISARTRRYRKSAMTASGKGDPTAPPLMPAHQKSRVRALLAGRALSSHCELYWRYDPFTGASWDVILTYQKAMGRDVFGISDEGMTKIRIQSWSAWTKWKKTGQAPTTDRTAVGAHALHGQGPQTRIARIIADSAKPHAQPIQAVRTGSYDMGTAITSGGSGAGWTGGKTGEGWRRWMVDEVKGKGPGKAAKAPAPKPSKPTPKPAPIMKPPQPKPVPPPIPVPAPMTVPAFAERAERAAGQVPTALRYAETKVWIIDAYHAFARSNPGVSLDQYKEMLVKANQARLVTLARCDMPGALSAADRLKDAASETHQGIAVFHWIRL